MSSDNDGSCSRSSIEENTDSDEEYLGADRLSDLTDALLITILSLLPVHSAVATFKLSRRWRYLWTQITRVYIRFPDDSHDRQDRFQANVATIENEIMPKLVSPTIRTFNLELSRDLSCLNVSSDCLVPWLQKICDRNPFDVQVNLGGICTFYTRPFLIPICVFQCQHLVKLYLHGNFYFGFFDDDPTTAIALPQLKKLALDLCYDEDITSIELLFAACPLLEDLNLTLSLERHYFLYNPENEVVVVVLSIPNLKSLRLHVVATNGKRGKIDINSPNLKTCHMEGHLAFYEFITTPENLQEVILSFKKTSFEDDDSDYINNTISGLIQGISCVADLTLERSGFHLLDCISRLDGPLPDFHNLSVLSLRINDWIGELPGYFFLGNLKRVFIRDVNCQVAEINLVQHILTEATTLEELYVVVPRPFWNVEEFQNQMEQDFCRKLFMLPKSSENCDICFFGNVSVASSKEHFKDGEITFQVRDFPDPLSDSDDTGETVDSD